MKLFNLTTTLLSGLVFSVPAHADVTVTSGGDVMDDSTYTTVDVTARHDDALMRFVCRSTNSEGRIFFYHDKFLVSSGRYFAAKMRFDKENSERHRFYSTPDSLGGILLYDEGFLESEFSKGLGSVQRVPGSRHEEFNKFTRRFGQADSILVRVFDYRENSYTYEFNPVGMTDKLDSLKPCWDG